MDFYILDMTKTNWTIEKFNGKRLHISKTYLDLLEEEDVVFYNEHFRLAKDKKELFEYANNLRWSRVASLQEEADRYRYMKIKSTRK